MGVDHTLQEPGSPVLVKLSTRSLTVVLYGLALAGQAAYLDALYWNTLGLGSLGRGGTQPALLSAVVTGAIVAVLAGVLGVTMAFRGSRDRGAFPLAISLAAWSYILSYSGLVVLMAPRLASPWRVVFEAHFLVVEALGLAGLLRFTVVFPSPLRPADLPEPGLVPVGLRTIQRVQRWLLRPWAPWLAGALACSVAFAANAGMGRSVHDAAFLPLVDFFRLAALAFVVLNIRSSFFSGTAGDRRAMLWLVLGFLLLLGAVGFLVGGNVLSAVTGWELPSLNWRPIVLDLGLVGLLWGAAMGVFYGGNVGPEALVRRATILSGMVTLALFLAAGLESLLTGSMVARLTLPQGLGTLASAMVVGILYARTRRPLDTYLTRAWANMVPPVAQG